MIRAIVKNGLIEPLEPLPTEWNNGRAVEIHETEDQQECTDEEMDEWLRRGNELAAAIDPKDLERMNVALSEADCIAKGQVRREMGLS